MTVRDKAYRESLKKIPDDKASSDPWGTVLAPRPQNRRAGQAEDPDRQQHSAPVAIRSPLKDSD